jgi:hypothetical protein
MINMPRIARQRSESGIYHIMLRGANRQEAKRTVPLLLGAQAA